MSEPSPQDVNIDLVPVAVAPVEQECSRDVLIPTHHHANFPRQHKHVAHRRPPTTIPEGVIVPTTLSPHPSVHNNGLLEEDPQLGDDDVIYIGNHAVLARDVAEGYGGTMTIGLSKATQKLMNRNPSPLGLAAFASTTLLLSLVNINIRHLHNGNIACAMGWFYGGLIQLIAGICEFFVDNSFGFTALCSYGGFWLSFSAVNAIPSITDGYTATQLCDVMGLYLLVWAVFTLMMCVLTVRTTVGFHGMFVCLEITYILLGAANLAHDSAGQVHATLQKAGGYFGIVTAALAYYNSFAGLASSEKNFFQIRGIHMPWSVHKQSLVTKISPAEAERIRSRRSRKSFQQSKSHVHYDESSSSSSESDHDDDNDDSSPSTSAV